MSLDNNAVNTSMSVVVSSSAVCVSVSVDNVCVLTARVPPGKDGLMVELALAAIRPRIAEAVAKGRCE